MSMVRNFKIELLRSGPEHNQLLSPLTPYLALGGASPPQTVTMPYEHRQLLARLARLRYQVEGQEVAASQREDELREVGEAMGRVLGAVPALALALDGSTRAGAPLLHLRLALSALELGMLPFEAAVAPEHLPGSGAPLLLRTPTILTREVRRNRTIDVQWDREPRLLYAFAAPGELPAVPAQPHLNALRRAIDPFVQAHRDEAKRVADAARLVTVLPNASLADIAAACRENDYTHVHLLAHGAPIERAGRMRYGVALAGEGGPQSVDVVDGERLAIALRGMDASGRGKQPPTLVSLATCDSGAVGEVLAPGGSIAHELHAEGIPWVVASQFPLWMRSSVIGADVLFSGLLAGQDPRWVLYELRQRLRTDAPQTHDWASIVVYAVAPWDFEDQVSDFRARQMRRRLDVRFARLDELIDDGDAGNDGEVDALVTAIRRDQQEWLSELDARAATSVRSRRLAMGAASEKRIAIVYARAAAKAAAAGASMADTLQQDSQRAYAASVAGYEAALRAEPTNHWVATQYLSLRAALAAPGSEGALREQFHGWWMAARQVAQWELAEPCAAGRAWALGTLAELELLGAVYGPRGYRTADAAARIAAQCREIAAVAGAGSFEVASTRRQFQRYRDHWPRSRWASLVKAALQALPAP